jgi:hypothetical protein
MKACLAIRQTKRGSAVPFEITLEHPAGVHTPRPNKYYDEEVGNFPDLIAAPCTETLGVRLESLSGQGYAEAMPCLHAATAVLRAHPKIAALAYEQALRALEIILERFEALPHAILWISQEGRSALGEAKLRGLTFDDLQAGLNREDENLDGDWDGGRESDAP